MSKPRTATVPLYDGDDFARLSELWAIAEHAQGVADDLQRRQSRRTSSRLGDDDATEAEDAQQVANEAKAEHDAFVDEAAERATPVRLQMLPGRKFRDLMAAHPPRKNNDEDAAVGFDSSTFPDALLEYVDADDPEIRTVIEPKHASKGHLKRWLDEQSYGDLGTWFDVAYGLNRSPAADPKALRYSTAPRTSAAT